MVVFVADSGIIYVDKDIISHWNISDGIIFGATTMGDLCLFNLAGDITTSSVATRGGVMVIGGNILDVGIFIFFIFDGIIIVLVVSSGVASIIYSYVVNSSGTEWFDTYGGGILSALTDIIFRETVF